MPRLTTTGYEREAQGNIEEKERQDGKLKTEIKDKKMNGEEMWVQVIQQKQSTKTPRPM